MSFKNFEVDADKIIGWENDVMESFDRSLGPYEGNKERILELIEICKAEINQPHSWLTEFAAQTALVNLESALDEC